MFVLKRTIIITACCTTMQRVLISNYIQYSIKKIFIPNYTLILCLHYYFTQKFDGVINRTGLIGRFDPARTMIDVTLLLFWNLLQREKPDGQSPAMPLDVYFLT